MSNDLLHIALSVSENDVIPFYEYVLKGFVKSTRILAYEDSLRIFDIPQSVSVVVVKYEGFELELFVCEKAHNVSFNHICIACDNSQEIYDNAKRIGYKTYARKSKLGNTFFIQDSMSNVFEIKTKV